jgi:TonB family protein
MRRVVSRGAAEELDARGRAPYHGALPMLHLSRARRSVLGSRSPGAGAPEPTRYSGASPTFGGGALGCAVLALALGCASAAPPPEAPAEPSLESSQEADPPGAAAAGDPSPAAEPESPTPEPSAAASSATASPPRDSRSKQEIQQVMANNRDKVRACYDAALAKNPGIAGDLVVDFTIDPRGDVKQAEVNWSQSEIHIPELDACAADAVRSLKFPASSRGLESKVSYPFNFNPPRQGSTGQSSPGPDAPGQRPPGQKPAQ